MHVADGQWHHVVGSFDGQETRLYVDGRPVGGHSRVKNYPGNVTCDLTIGADRSNPDPELGEVDASFNGMMDDVMMFNRALSPDEVEALFKAQGGVSAPAAYSSNPAPSNPVSPGSGTGNAAEKLRILKQAFDQGLISKEVYDQKVKQILDGM